MRKNKSRTPAEIRFSSPEQKTGPLPPEKGKTVRQTANLSFKKIHALCKVLWESNGRKTKKAP